MQHKIILADDHFVIRKGLKLICEVQLGIPYVSEVASCNQLMKELLKNDYTHLILDLSLPDGSTLEIIPTIKKLYPKLQIMVFTMQSEVVYKRVLRNYSIRYCSKAAQDKDTMQQLRQFLNNEAIPADNSSSDNSENPFALLSPRELEILHYLLQGLTNNEVAKSLNLKWNTISTVKNRIFEKTQTSNLLQLKELATVYKVSGLI